MTKRASVLGLVFAVLCAVAPSEARAHDRPMYAGFGGGPYVFWDWYGNVHGRVVGEFGIHFSPDDRGFFLAFEAHTTFGEQFFMLFGGVRLGGDIEVYGEHDYGIMLRPSGLIGFGWHDWNGFNGPDGDHGFFVFQPAFDVRFAFAHRVCVFWVRPVAFDILLYWDAPWRRGFWEFTAGYQFLFGFDFQFG